jgi:RND family efflux transporter MFP subunit
MKPVFRYLLCLSLLLLAGQTFAQTAPKVVEMAKPNTLPHVETLSLTGTFSAKQRSLLSPRVDGLVATLLVDAGDRVKKGDRLLQLDHTQAKLAMAEQQAALEEAIVLEKEAQRLVKEAEKLRQQRHIPETELTRRQADLAQNIVRVSAMKAALATAKEIVNRHTLYAPFDGVISNKNTEVGEWVSRGDAILTLTNLRSLDLDVKVPQERITTIQVGNPVQIRPDSAPNLIIEATIDTIVPVGDNNSRAFLARIAIDASDKPLLPGTSASVELQLPSHQSASIVIPRDALLLHPDGGHSVFVVGDNDIAKRHIVTLGQTVAEGVVITSGIHASDQIVIRGNEVLNDGDTVTPYQPQR